MDANFIDRLRQDIDAEIEVLMSVATHEVGIRDANAEYKRRRQQVHPELGQLGVRDPNPWRDLWGWYGHYSGVEELRTYQARRDFILALYQPVLDSLDGLEQRRLGSGIRMAPTGWTDVDRQVGALERAYAAASTPEEFRQVGLLCRDLFISTSYVVFDGDKHLPKGVKLPSKDDAKNRLDYAIGGEYGGRNNEELRAMLRATWRFVQPRIHDQTDDQTKAMIAADVTISLVKILGALFPQPTGHQPFPGLPEGVFEEEPPWEPSEDDLRDYLTHMIDEEDLEP